MTLLLSGLIFGFAVSLLFLEFAVRPHYAQTIALLIADRDLARHEAQVLRGILCPALNRKTNEAAQGEPAPAKPAVADAHPAGRGTPQSKGETKARRRMSFRVLFNQARKQTNSKQIKTDALATALDKIKVPTQEKTHV